LKETTSEITLQNKLDHFLARWGWRRSSHLVEPGIYAIGDPRADSPVFVTANYTLSFDALRSALEGTDAYILVLDTKGINVWCAAGKGTFGTEELVSRIEQTGLADIVETRKLTLPQLGASGVSGYKVKERSGFKVEFGPIRAEDIPEYLRLGRATEEMRRMRFPLKDRVVLIPVELINAAIPAAAGTLAMMLLDGPVGAAAAAAAAFSGLVLFPIKLPYLPGREFSFRGFVLGGLTALPFAMFAFLKGNGGPGRRALRALFYMLVFPPTTSFLALNFTGSTPIASKSGVEDEIYKWIPVMAWTAGAGVTIALGLAIDRLRRSEMTWRR
jgi:hypothetical protein